MGYNYYTVKYGDKWASRREGSDRVSKVFDTQKEAMKFSRSQAKQNKSEHRIQGKDGKFRDADSYGKDKFPPEG
ncbi:DUF2188 domain-containing protein [Halobacillus karajensis]|uniref:DUF2188 domain-containing protein n=1 Tax=Halobacillus karajensis TaxID=195088 RepID=UPI00045D2343|nr:DUF2188 domain-containing protein [Halobacillus karajensis]CDQ17957.1 hypothetical protein BN982_00197 [Halobacillus karajensis]